MWSISIYKILIGVVILWSPDDMAQYTIQSDVQQIERPRGMSSRGGKGPTAPAETSWYIDEIAFSRVFKLPSLLPHLR